MLESTTEVTTNKATYLVSTAVLIIFTARRPVCPTITNFNRSDSFYYVNLQSQRKITVAQGIIVSQKGVSPASRLPMSERICKFTVCTSRDSAHENTHTLWGKTSHKIWQGLKPLTLPLLASDLKVMKSNESKSAANIVPDTVEGANGNSTRTRLATAAVFYSRPEVSKNQSLPRKIIMCLCFDKRFGMWKFFVSQNKTLLWASGGSREKLSWEQFWLQFTRSIFSKQVLKIYIHK